MKLTAKEFNNNPAAAYRAADKGEKVTITHDRFEGDFVLVSKNKDDMWEDVSAAGQMMQSQGMSEEDAKRMVENLSEEELKLFTEEA